MKVTFFCVQPITISLETYLEIVNYDILPDIENADKLPYWMTQLKKISNIAYENTLCLNVEKVNDIFIKKDIEKNISELILLNKVNACLLFDYKLLSFTLCLEVEMDLSYFSEKDLDNLISTKGVNNNFYFKARELLVREDSDSIISKWTDMTIDNSFIAVKEAFKTFYTYDIDIEKDLEVKPSTGNITAFIDLNEEKYQDKKIIDKFMLLNYEADRFDIENPLPLELGEFNQYYFGGRLHTITYSDKRNLISYYTIQYQMQHSWFYSALISKLYNKINSKLMDREKRISYRDKNKLINYFINKISIFELENESFKMAIENNNEKIYKKIESKWNVEKTIINLSTYIKRLEKVLKEEHNNLIAFEKASKSGKEKELLEKIDELNEERRLLKEAGDRDHLTRAYNRQKFDADLEEYFLSNNEPMFLAFVDGDKFKDINDNYGHQAGDEVLKKIVNIMFASLKSNEVTGGVYRYGGEEFILTMFNEKNSSALGALNMIKDAIEKSEIIYNDHVIKFTISIGAVKSQEGQTMQEVVELSDQLVYKAKENGRNRIEFIF